MKKLMAIFLFLITLHVGGQGHMEFKNWGDVIGLSPNIIVVRCLVTPDMLTLNPHPRDNPWELEDSEIEVIAILRGDGKPGYSHLGSFYHLHRDENFLIFANNFTPETPGVDSKFLAIEDFRVIPMRTNFPIEELTGKSLDDQIHLIFTNRFTDLNEEINRASRERLRLERMWNTNAPPQTITNGPARPGGGDF